MSAVTVFTFNDRHIEELLRAARIEHVVVRESELTTLANRATPPDGVLIVDLRDRQSLPAGLVNLKRLHPGANVIIVTSTMDPTLMLEAMRAGVNECVSEPLKPADLETAISRLKERQKAPLAGLVFAFLGSRGGVGTTTVAVNVATELARSDKGSTLLVDLHAAFGDAALFLGAEPRFTLTDAVENANRLDEAFLRGLVVRTKGRPDVLASPPRTRLVPLDANGIRAVVEFAARVYRYVVLDLTLYDPAAPEVLALAAKILVVTNQELTSVRNAARIVGDLKGQYGKDRVAVVVNRADRNAEIGLEDVERAVGQKVEQVLASDYREAIKALNAGVPLTVNGSGRLAAGFRKLASSLASPGPVPEAPAERQRSSIFARFGGRRPPVSLLGAMK
ncbi:MAG: CpaE family protein [Vicinamibacterales bacterium]